MIPMTKEDCYGRECELRKGDKCLHPDVKGDPIKDEPGEVMFCMFCPKIKHDPAHILNKIGR